MLPTFWKRSNRPSGAARRWPSAFHPTLEQLMDRVVPTVTAGLDGSGILTITGDDTAEIISVQTNLATNVHRVFEGSTLRGEFSITAVNQLRVFANGGADVIDLTALAPPPSLIAISVDGGVGDDNIDGSTGNDTISGGLGNDTLRGNQGNDFISGGEELNDHDVLREVGNANFTLNQTQLIGTAGFGTDTVAGMERWHLTGGSSANVLNALNAFGQGTLVGLGGDDALTGGDFQDMFEGGQGNDTINGGNGGFPDTVVATATVSGAFTISNSSLTAPGLGTDSLTNIGKAVLTGASGADTFTVTNFSGEVEVDGGLGNDRLVCTLVGPANPSNMTLNSQFLLRSSGGNVRHDNIEFATLTGNSLGNIINATGFGGVSVTIVGGDGDDTLTGSGGADSIQGNDGDDTITGGAGSDTIDGGGGVGGGTDTLVETNLAGTVVLGDENMLHAGFTDTLSNIDRAVLTGTAANNTMNAGGFSKPVTLNGLGGDDNLLGGSGDDVLNGGNDDDTLDGNGGDDTLNGGQGTDTVNEEGNTNFTLTNTALNTSIGSGLGDDTLNSVEQAELTGGSGSNTINASAFTLGSVTLRGEGGDDTLFGGSQPDNLHGGTGDDEIHGNGGNDIITGSFGADAIFGDSGLDTLNEGFSSTTDKTFSMSNTATVFTDNGSAATVDQLNSIERANIVMLAGDNDIFLGNFTGTATITGGSGDDRIAGSNGDDVLDGGGGVNTLRVITDTNASLTDSTLSSSDGTDQHSNFRLALLEGNNAANVLDATAFTGNVRFFGNGGNDTLLGGSGVDTFTDGTGFDVIRGGDGNDVLELTQNDGFDDDVDLQGGEDGIVIHGTAGNDVIRVSRVVDADGPKAVITINGVTEKVLYRNGETITVLAGGGNDVVWMDESTAITWRSILFGEGGDDLLIGAGRNDYIDGGAGNDTLYGQGGDDTLLGGDGKDVLYGGDGCDVLDGGNGKDTLNGGAGVDAILSADGERDRIAIDPSDLVNKDNKDEFYLP